VHRERPCVLRETKAVIDFLVRSCRPLLRNLDEPVLLELGGGPTIYQLLPLASEVAQIHFTDFLASNLREVRRWTHKSRNAFDWKPYSAYTASILSPHSSRLASSASLEDVLRSKLVLFGYCDVFDPVITSQRYQYQVINCHFVPESSTMSKSRWEIGIANIAAKIEPGGLLFMSAVRGAGRGYMIGTKTLPAVGLDERDFVRTFRQNGLKILEMHSMTTEPSNHYDGLILLVARRTGLKPAV
jgi:hypothetical protein